MVAIAEKLPDKSWVDILTMLKMTFGQSKDGLVNNFNEDTQTSHAAKQSSGLMPFTFSL